jgi:lipid-binding SYLF domain-containing protein
MYSELPGHLKIKCLGCVAIPQVFTMKRALFGTCLAMILSLASMAGHADKFDDAIAFFRGAGASAAFFEKCYGYAVLPNVSEGAFGLGGAHGKGRVYVRDQHVGDTGMTQVSLGFQAGIQIFRQIIFFEDERAFREFTSGSFEFDTEMSMALGSSGASAAAGSAGVTAGAGGGGAGVTAGGYHKGIAVFVVPKGGGMVEWSIGGQRYSYRPLHESEPTVTDD